MTDAYVGQIQTFSFNFAPRDWAMCNGATLQQSQYSALFSLIGKIYGGDDLTFNLPNASGRILIGQGMAPGASHDYQIGETGGTGSVMLAVPNLPAHTHTLSASTAQARTPIPSPTSVLAQGYAISESGSDSPVNLYAPADKNVQALGGVVPVGDFINVAVMNPYQVVIPCICLSGAMPPRPAS